MCASWVRVCVVFSTEVRIGCGQLVQRTGSMASQIDSGGCGWRREGWVWSHGWLGIAGVHGFLNRSV